MDTEEPSRPYVTVDDLRRLLQADNAGAQLLLVTGAVRLSAAEDDGMPLVDRDELVERIGTAPADNQLVEQAELLNTLIRLQGS